MAVLAHIREQYRLSLGSYGRPRMTMELKEAGLAVGERRVGRLMRLNGIKPVRTRRHKVTTDSNHRLGVAPNQKWAGDITYIWTLEGWLYLAIILDLHSRRVLRREMLYPVFSSNHVLAPLLHWRGLMPGTFLRPNGAREPDWLRKEGSYGRKRINDRIHPRIENRWQAGP